MDYILTAEENASRQMIVSEGATLDGDKITVSSRGTYTVKMKIGDIESNELKIDVKAEGANLALKKDIVFATEGSKTRKMQWTAILEASGLQMSRAAWKTMSMTQCWW